MLSLVLHYGWVWDYAVLSLALRLGMRLCYPLQTTALWTESVGQSWLTTCTLIAGCMYLHFYSNAIYPCIYYLPIRALILTLKHILYGWYTWAQALQYAHVANWNPCNTPWIQGTHITVVSSLWSINPGVPALVLVDFEFKCVTKGNQISGWFFSCFYWILNTKIHYIFSNPGVPPLHPGWFWI